MTEVTASEPPGDTLVEGSSGRPLAVPDSLHSQLFLLAYDGIGAGSTGTSVGDSASPCARRC